MEMYGKFNNKEERDNDPGYQRQKAMKSAARSKALKMAKNHSPILGKDYKNPAPPRSRTSDAAAGGIYKNN